MTEATSATASAVGAVIERAYRDEWARLVAALARRFGDLDLAEEAAAEAFAAAADRWPRAGLPPNPGGWLATTATRKAIDRLRRESSREAKQREALAVVDDSTPEPVGPIEDDRLRLIFTCCHPALAIEARVALTLRLVGGLTVPEIAGAFLVREATIAQRITRAKTKIRAARIPYRVPDRRDLHARLPAVLAVLHLVFNEGYLPGSGTVPLRTELSEEALRLTRLLHALLPDEGEVAGLLALMVLTEARRAARISDGGELVTLPQQDRTLWSRALIEEGHALVRARLAAVAEGRASPGPYQLLAAINALHTAAASAEETDWSQIVANYDRLVAIDPSPVVRLNRAVAIGELFGSGRALIELDPLAAPLDGYHAFHAARADLLRRAGERVAAVAAYDRAIDLAGNPAERAHLTRRREEAAR